MKFARQISPLLNLRQVIDKCFVSILTQFQAIMPRQKVFLAVNGTTFGMQFNAFTRAGSGLIFK